ncbi:sushi domain-containing protein 4-like isoform X2 [Echeneis naucrates]|uniref:Sushi domain-containing protein 4-like n=2 Tax=Echeneis naucrates TaxID=173247 RepID=A0A665VXY3_ECHNA|nr:sushi domain-containing protein 4-like isoform X2 [Echeneis naucrates]XP_029349695.1 sushi domain-containing protein 4-like isoform X2 [Echeneis naucrates]
MCNGMTECTSKASLARISATKRSFFFLLGLTVVSTGQGSGCLRPYMVQNSWVNLTETNRGSFPVGTVLQYSCDPGYLPDGPSILTCTTLGHWSSEPPRCIRSGACLPLTKPENGGYTCHPSPCRMFSHGTVIEFFCDEGFIVSGDYNYLTCQDGQWDGPMQISCVSRGCTRPSMVTNGSTNLTDTNQSLFPVGTVLQYNCDPGYVPAGPSVLTCTTQGHWSSEPPRCIHSDVCQPPYQLENGGYICHPSPCGRLSHGTLIQYFCDEGYVLKGDYVFHICQYGKWDNKMPVSCLLEQDKGCVRPSMVQHGSTNLTGTNRSLFPVGTALQYSCDPGYLLDGLSILTCSAQGHWSSEPPRCIHSDVCKPPYEPENGGYTCHPSPCQRLTHGTVIEYFCDEGYILKGDYKYLTCQYGEWDSQMKLSCFMEQDRDPALPLGMPALSIVASTASSVALILLLVVLFVLLQPKLKSLHRRDQGVSGQPVSIMVEGVQVTLPSYEEAVSSGGASASASALSSESRVQIVLSEGQHATTPESGPTRPSSLKQQHSEMAVVHPAPPSSSSPSPSSSTWVLEHAGAVALSSSQSRPSAGSDQHSLSLDSEMDYSDDMPLLKEA